MPRWASTTNSEPDADDGELDDSQEASEDPGDDGSSDSSARCAARRPNELKISSFAGPLRKLLVIRKGLAVKSGGILTRGLLATTSDPEAEKRTEH